MNKRKKRAITLLAAMVMILCGSLLARGCGRKDPLGGPSGSPGGHSAGSSQLAATPDASNRNIPAPIPIKQDILPVNPYSRPGTRLEQVNGVVIHYTANPGTTAEQNRSYYGNLASSGATYASSHFIIGIDGTVIQCVPLDEIAYCSNKRNDDTISIECCHRDATGKFSDATYESLVKLTAWLCNLYDLEKEDIIRHYDVTGKLCPKYFVDSPDAWYLFKNKVEQEKQQQIS